MEDVDEDIRGVLSESKLSRARSQCTVSLIHEGSTFENWKRQA